MSTACPWSGRSPGRRRHRAAASWRCRPSARSGPGRPGPNSGSVTVPSDGLALEMLHPPTDLLLGGMLGCLPGHLLEAPNRRQVLLDGSLGPVRHPKIRFESRQSTGCGSCITSLVMGPVLQHRHNQGACFQQFLLVNSDSIGLPARSSSGCERSLRSTTMAARPKPKASAQEQC